MAENIPDSQISKQEQGHTYLDKNHLVKKKFTLSDVPEPNPQILNQIKSSKPPVIAPFIEKLDTFPNEIDEGNHYTPNKQSILENSQQPMEENKHGQSNNLEGQLEDQLPVNNVSELIDIPKKDFKNLHQKSSGPPKLKKARFFFFVNEKSGGNKGKFLTSLSIDKCTIEPKIGEEKYPQYKSIVIYIINLINTEHRNQGVLKAKKYTCDPNCQDDLFGVCCGGDGTIIWVTEEFIKFKVDFQKIALVLLPFGTGNDFARATGFSPYCPNEIETTPYQGMLNQIKCYIKCEKRLIDIWDLEITCHKGGMIRRIEKKKTGGFSKEPITHMDKEKGTEVPSLYFQRKMSNYCSIGQDARVGFGFDKRRGNSKCFNMCMYGWEGMKKGCSKSSNIAATIEKLEVIFEDPDYISRKHDDNNENVIEEKLNNKPEDQTEKEKDTFNDNFGFNSLPNQESVKKINQSFFHKDTGQVLTNPQNVEQYNQTHKISKNVNASDIEEVKLYINERNAKDVYDLNSVEIKEAKKQEIERIKKNNMPDVLGDAQSHIMEGYHGGIDHHFKSKVVFRTISDSKESKEKHTDHIMTINPVTIIGLNIQSYAAGTFNMWNKAGKETPIVSKDKFKFSIADQQCFGDGKLEWLGYNTRAALGMEAVKSGMGRRLAQGEGPFLFTFRKKESENGKAKVAYLNIDGEYMQLIDPKNFKVSTCSEIPHGKIMILYKNFK